MLTPITRMHERYRAEKEESDVSAFYCLMFFGELITKVTVCAVLSGMTDDRDRNRYGLLHDLVRADGIGSWTSVMDLALTGPSAQFLKDEFKDLQRELLQRTASGEWQHEAISLLHETIESLQIEVGNLPPAVPLRQWFMWFALLRNKTRSHGATLAFECSRAVPLLEHSLRVLNYTRIVSMPEHLHPPRIRLGRAFLELVCNQFWKEAFFVAHPHPQDQARWSCRNKMNGFDSLCRNQLNRISEGNC